MTNRVYFNGVDSAFQSQLWITDGTAAGTFEIVPAGYTTGTQPQDITALSTTTLFNGQDRNGLSRLWATDGTAAGTVVLAVTGESATGLAPADITRFGTGALFEGADTPGNLQLWVTDGSAAGTTELTAALGPAGGVDPVSITALGMAAGATLAVFNGLDAKGMPQLYATNGKVAGTQALAVAGENASGLDPIDFAVFNGGALFFGLDQTGGEGLWFTQGSAASTTELAPEPGAGATGLTVSGNQALFEDGNSQLAITNGQASGTHELAVAGASAAGLQPADIVAFGAGALFAGVDQANAASLWITDGTAAGTKELAAFGSNGALADITIFGAKALFSGTDGTGAPQLWITDGTSAGTAELLPGGAYAFGLTPTEITVIGSQALFDGYDTAGNPQLWTTDGTAAGTTIVAAGNGNAFGLAPSDLTLAPVPAAILTISSPGMATIGVGRPGAIQPVSIAETGAPSGEIVTVTLTDAHGMLAAPSGTTSMGGTVLTLVGTVPQVNTALAGLTDTDATPGAGTITINAVDRLGTHASTAMIALTVNGLPVISAPATATISSGMSAPISPVSLAESGNTSGETFTVGLTDSYGHLSATGTGVTGSGTTSLTVTGTLAQVNADLATLHDSETGAPRDTITLKATDGFGNTATQAVSVIVISPSAISGTVAGQVTTDEQSIKPFAKVAISDPNPGASTETVTITPSSTANGTLFDPAAAADGSTVSQGVYKITGTAAAVTTAIDGLVFIPTAHEVTPGASVTTGFTISATNSAAMTAADSATSVKATAVNDPPTITGGKSGQTGVDYLPLKPFATVAIADPDLNVTDSLTITLRNASGAASDANGVLTSTGLTKTGTGTYALAAATPAALTMSLQGVSFTPTQHETAPGQTTTTNFAITATQTAGGTTVSTTNTTTSVVETALNYITGPAGGFGVIIGTTGSDVIVAQGSFNTIFSNGGNDFINAGAGHAFVNACTGNDSIVLGGSFNAVIGLDGNDSVTGGPGGYNAVTLGNGADSVSVGGSNDVIILGNGGDSVSGTQVSAIIATGSGNDTIVVGGAGNTINAGAGTNSITGGTGTDTFVLPGANKGFDLIRNFTLTNGDVLDLAGALHETSWNQQASTLGNYLKVTSGGGNTTLSIAPSGSGGGTAVAQLAGSGNLALQDLVSHGSLHTSFFGF